MIVNSHLDCRGFLIHITGKKIAIISLCLNIGIVNIAQRNRSGFVSKHFFHSLFPFYRTIPPILYSHIFQKVTFWLTSLIRRLRFV